jgi:hypothetical protein
MLLNADGKFCNAAGSVMMRAISCVGAAAQRVPDGLGNGAEPCAGQRFAYSTALWRYRKKVLPPIAKSTQHAAGGRLLTIKAVAIGVVQPVTLRAPSTEDSDARPDCNGYDWRHPPRLR